MKKKISFFIAGAALTLSLILYYKSRSNLTIVDGKRRSGKGWRTTPLIDRMESECSVKRAKVKLEQTKISIKEAKAKLEASERTYADPSELESTLKVKEDNYQQALIAGDSAERNLKNAQELYNIGAESLLILQDKKDQLKTAEIDLLKTGRELEDARRFFSKKENTTLNLTNLKAAYESTLKQKDLAEVELELALQNLERLTCISALAGTVIAVEVGPPDRRFSPGRRQRRKDGSGNNYSYG